jgi:hypothetical protein
MSVEVKSEKNGLSISVCFDKPTISATGKSLVLGSTHGSKPTGIMYKGQKIVLNLNAFVCRSKKEGRQRKPTKTTKGPEPPRAG